MKQDQDPLRRMCIKQLNGIRKLRLKAILRVSLQWQDFV